MLRPILWLCVAGLLATAALAAAQPRQLVYLPALSMPTEPELTPQVLRIARVVLVGPGPDGNADEYVQIANVGAAPVGLGGLRLMGGAGLTRAAPYVLPPGCALAPGASALVFSKAGSDNPAACLFYVGSLGRVWSPGLTAELRDAQGRLLSSLVVTGRPPPTPVPPPGGVEIVDVVLRDPAFPDDTEEYVQLTNVSGAPIDMGGWRLLNATRGGQVPPFVFPSYSLGVDVTIAVFSGVGEDDLDIGDFYWDRQADIWRVGDTAELRDAQNRLVATLVVPQQ